MVVLVVVVVVPGVVTVAPELAVVVVPNALRKNKELELNKIPLQISNVFLYSLLNYIVINGE